MPHIFDPKKLKKLESKKRYDAVKPKELLKEAGLKAGDTVLDFGVGTGFFAVSALEIIGENGKLFGTDISKDMLEYTKERTENFSNVELILSDENEIPVKEKNVAFAMMAFVLHELPNKEKVLSQIKRILKPGGELLIIDWSTENIKKGPPVNDRISLENASKLLKETGFSVKTEKEKDFGFYYITSTN